jgi:hypothetical protein
MECTTIASRACLFSRYFALPRGPDQDRKSARVH